MESLKLLIHRSPDGVVIEWLALDEDFFDAIGQIAGKWTKTNVSNGIDVYHNTGPSSYVVIETPVLNGEDE